MTENAESGFWDRQVDEIVTNNQIVFDILFGIVVPILCLVFDPFVFRGEYGPLLGRYSFFAYTVIGLGICSFGLWLLLRDKLPFEALGLITGILRLGSILSFLLGIMLFPFSLLGLGFTGLGLLGFTPFITAYVYHRNGKKAHNHIKRYENTKMIPVLMAIGIVLVLAVPIGMQWRANSLVERSMEMILYGDARSAEQGVASLQRAFWCQTQCYDQIVWAYHEEEDSTHKEFLESAYFQLTGEEIEDRLWRLLD